MTHPFFLMGAGQGQVQPVLELVMLLFKGPISICSLFHFFLMWQLYKHADMIKFWNFLNFLNHLILHRLKRYQGKSLFPKGFELPLEQRCCCQCLLRLIIFLITQMRKMKAQDLEFLLGKMWPFACPDFSLQMQWNTKSHTISIPNVTS